MTECVRTMKAARTMILRYCVGPIVALALMSVARADTVQLKPELAGIAFLVGAWSNGTGEVADTGETSRGSSTIEPEVGGAALLRRDHTQLIGADGKPRGSFDQIMLIYAEAGTVRADYSDGQHVIHYTSAAVIPGKSVTFATTVGPNAPSFRLHYELQDSGDLAVRFEIAAPNQSQFRPVATGTLHKRNS